MWDAIEDSATEAASMKLRAELANEIIERMRERRLTQAKAAQLIGVTQPRISDLMRAGSISFRSMRSSTWPIESACARE